MHTYVHELQLGINRYLIDNTSVINHVGEYNIFEIKDSLHNRQKAPVFITECLYNVSYTGTIFNIMYQESSWCSENRTVMIETPGVIHLKSHGARTTAEYNPFIRLYTDKGIVTLHVLAVGDWEISIDFNRHNDTHTIKSGLLSDGLSMKLKPGERITLPEILIHEFPSDDENACNEEFQKYLNHRFLSKKAVNLPTVYNSWFYDFDKFSADDLKKQALAAKELGARVFVVDAGWYGPENDDWSKAAGDWREKKAGGFLGKMKAFAQYVRSIGMDFGLWIEPEKVCAGTPVIEQHPKWFIKSDEGVFYPDLMRPAAFNYLYRTICKIIERYDVKWLKFDFNFPLKNDPHKSNFFRHMSRFYEMVELIREAYPETVLEGCQSGAMRADLESTRHFDTQFLSDTVRPRDIVEIFSNSLCRFSPSMLSKWIVVRRVNGIPRYGTPLNQAGGHLIVPKGPTWDNFESCDTATLCHLIYLGQTGFSGDLTGLDEKTIEMIKKHLGIYEKYFKGYATTAICLKTNEPGWSIFRIQSEVAEITVAFRKPGSVRKCNGIKMPGTDYACSRLRKKSL